MNKAWLGVGIGGAVLIGLVLIVFLLPSSSPLSDKPVVATTIFPLTDMASEVAGDAVDVVQIIPAGASPHSYTLTPQQVADLQAATVIFAVGHGLDDSIVNQAQKVSGAAVVVVDSGIPLREFGEEEHEDEEESEDDHGHAEGSVDPHYWLTAPNAQLIVRTISDALATYFPEHEFTFSDQAASYIGDLKDLEAELQQLASQANQQSIVTMHDAWAYFAEQYGFEIVGTYEPVEGRQPSVADVRELQETVSEHGISVFYAEPQKESSTATRFLEEELGLDIQALDPIGGITGRSSYIELMRYDMNTLVDNGG